VSFKWNNSWDRGFILGHQMQIYLTHVSIYVPNACHQGENSSSYKTWMYSLFCLEERDYFGDQLSPHWASICYVSINSEQVGICSLCLLSDWVVSRKNASLNRWDFRKPVSLESIKNNRHFLFLFHSNFSKIKS
jgi:hypothetical protein